MQQNSFGCFGWVVVLAVLVALGSLTQCVGNLFDGDSKSSGPIPKRYQGAYNSVACGSTAYIDGLVTVGDDDVSYGGARFEATSVVSQTDNGIKLRGRPFSAGGTEPERDFTITYTAVGGTANIDGAVFHRCSQYR